MTALTSLAEELNTELSVVAERATHSLAQVHTASGGTGAATIWHPDGLIITNAHVARGGPLAVALSDGTTLKARLLARDPARDVAALMVSASGLPTIPLGNDRGLRPGDWALALGHPGGVWGAATAGVVIGVGSLDQGLLPLGGEWVLMDLHLRPGYSGGPLLDAQGRMVGVNTVMAGPSVGLAVPVHVVKAFLREALGAPRSRAWAQAGHWIGPEIRVERGDA